MTIYGIVRIGGFLIWLWKRYVCKDKKIKLDDEIDDVSWRAWVVGVLAICVFVFINMIIVAKCYGNE